MIRRNRKIIPPTGDPEIDSFNHMRNDIIKKNRTKAPLIMNMVEEKVLLKLIPIQGVARVVAQSKANAEYIKVRIRKFLISLKLNDMVATSVQNNEVIIWRIAKYQKWRIKQPVEDSPIWQDAQADSVTLYQEYSKGRRNDDLDINIIKEAVNELSSKKNQWLGVNLDVVKEVLANNYKNALLTTEEYEEKLTEINKEIERRKNVTA